MNKTNWREREDAEDTKDIISLIIILVTGGALGLSLIGLSIYLYWTTWGVNGLLGIIGIGFIVAALTWSFKQLNK